MRQTQYVTRVLKADEGYLLTEADDLIDISVRTFADTVYLGVNDSPERWREIAEAEVKAMTSSNNVDKIDGN